MELKMKIRPNLALYHLAFHKQMLAGFALALLALVAVAVISYRSTTGLIDTAHEVSRTHEVVNSLGHLRSDVIDIETGVRGYAITGNEKFLDWYQQLLPQVPEHFKSLRNMIVVPQQQRRLDELEPLVSRKLAWMKGLILIRKEQGLEVAVREMQSLEGKELMDEVRVVIGTMNNEEETLLKQREEKTRSRSRFAIGLGVTLNLVIFALLTWVCFGTQRQFAARKLAEAALKAKVEDLARLATVVLDSNDAVIMHDFDGKIMAWNRGAKEMYGYTEAEALSKNVRDIVAEADREAALALIQKIKQGEVVKSFELRRTTKDGRILDVWLTTTLLTDETGKPVAIATTERDITARKKAEEEVRQLNAGLEQRVLNRTVELQAANKELEAFSYSVSHDLRAPLRAIDGFSQALMEDCADKLDEEGQGYLQRVRAGTQRMGQLIDDLLRLSQVTRGELQRDQVNLTAMAKVSVQRLQQSEPQRQVECIIAPDLTAHADGRLVQVILDNLLGNAWKFTAKHPSARIEVGMSQKDGQRAFFVRDDGAGFEMAHAGKLFGAFQRLHNQTEFQGTGIGLAMVQRIARRFGGDVWAESAVEQGTTIYFTLKTKGQP